MGCPALGYDYLPLKVEVSTICGEFWNIILQSPGYAPGERQYVRKQPIVAPEFERSASAAFDMTKSDTPNEC